MCSGAALLYEIPTIVIGENRTLYNLDFPGIYRAIRSAGLDLPERPIPEDLDGRVVTHHTKAAVGGVAAAALGDPAVFVLVAGLQSGPAGGGSVAAIVDLS